MEEMRDGERRNGEELQRRGNCSMQRRDGGEESCREERKLHHAEELDGGEESCRWERKLHHAAESSRGVKWRRG